MAIAADLRPSNGCLELAGEAIAKDTSVPIRVKD
jgi:hypothetical protein